MENTEPNTEQNTNKMLVSSKVDPAIYSAISYIAREEDRSVSNVVERLVKQHPRVIELLEAANAETAAEARA